MYVEESLPQQVCMACASHIINSYLFKKMCSYSQEKWHEVLDHLQTKIEYGDNLASNPQSLFIPLGDNDAVIYTSKKKYQANTTKLALNKFKAIVKSRSNYMKIKSEIIDVMCDECGLSFSSKYLLSKHVKTHKHCKLPCPQCPKLFTSEAPLKEHIERIHFEKTIKCKQCQKKFSTQKILKQHIKLHHEPVACKLCLDQFPSRNLLRAHLDKHTSHVCLQCNKTYLNKWTFKFHQKICGVKVKETSFICDLCGKGYARKNGLRTHMKTDHGFGKIISCDWCGKKFDAISRLKYHIVKHTRERNYTCEKCGGKFVTSAALIYHTRLHTGEKPFPCDLCEESFLSASRRMEHKHRKHFGPQRECSVCLAKFVTGHQLKKHLERHFNPQSKLFAPNVKIPVEEWRINYDSNYMQSTNYTDMHIETSEC